jgi:hypothetical protein
MGNQPRSVRRLGTGLSRSIAPVVAEAITRALTRAIGAKVQGRNSGSGPQKAPGSAPVTTYLVNGEPMTHEARYRRWIESVSSPEAPMTDEARRRWVESFKDVLKGMPWQDSGPPS